MASRDPRIDAYIAKAAPFARPILTHLRELVQRTAPTLTETMKWSMPNFTGNGLVCSMAAFKAHCAFGFWHGERVVGDAKSDAMGQLGRITALSDLPSDKVLVGYIRAAVKLDGEGVKRTPAKRGNRAELPVPPELAAALRKNAKARATFDGFPPSARHEYLEWLHEAKTDTTRAKRLATTIEWLAEGKRRNWKYESC